jgi:hypothetical protein
MFDVPGSRMYGHNYLQCFVFNIYNLKLNLKNDLPAFLEL